MEWTRKETEEKQKPTKASWDQEEEEACMEMEMDGDCIDTAVLLFVETNKSKSTMDTFL